MRRKIGILTFHRCFNYGSYWQARCLLEALSTCGAALLNHYSWRVNLAEWKCGLQPVLSARFRGEDLFFYSYKIFKFLRALSSLPHSRNFSLAHPQKIPFFSTVIVGSDEVWNLFHPWYGGYSLFFGEGIRAVRLISYAASFGNYDATRGLERKWTDRLKRFHAVSVRDENSQYLIEKSLGVSPPLVLDPCLQFPISLRGTWHGPQKPFVVIYGHSFSRPFALKIQCWARSQGYQTISIGYRNAWADRQWITAGPDDFAHAIAHAKAVATNFFHGCVFALRNAKPFVVELSSYRTNKIQNFLKVIGSEERLFFESTPRDHYSHFLTHPPESKIFERIQRLRGISESYLNGALTC